MAEIANNDAPIEITDEDFYFDEVEEEPLPNAAEVVDETPAQQAANIEPTVDPAKKKTKIPWKYIGIGVGAILLVSILFGGKKR